MTDANAQETGTRGSLPLSLLVPIYALAVHVAVIAEEPAVGLGALTLVAIIALIPVFARSMLVASVATGLGVPALAAAWHHDIVLELLYLPPIAVTAMALALFASTLPAGRTPLVTDIALRMGAPATPALRRYTRRVTLAWTIFLAALLAECIALALIASPAVWSLFTNLINYVLIGGFFAAEFAVRRRSLPAGQRHARFSEFLAALGRTSLRGNGGR